MSFEFRGVYVESFIDYCEKVRLDDDDVLNQVEEFIMAWHGSDGWDMDLSEAIGLSDDEYTRFMGDHEYILTLIRSEEDE